MRLAVMATLFCMGLAVAQTPPIQAIKTPVAPAKVASPKVMLVKPDGAKTQAVGDIQFEQRTEWVGGDVSSREYLNRNGLAVDSRTLEAFKKLNPQVRADGTIPAGSKVSVFAPSLAGTPNSAGANQTAAVDMSQLAKFSVSRQVFDAQQARLQTAQVPHSAYLRAEDVVVHKRLVADLGKAADLVQQRADKMTAMDLALSKHYLSSANASAANLARAAKVNGVASEDLTQLQARVAPVQQIQLRLSIGQSPFDYRNVVVAVTSRSGDKAPPPLRVYVLPGGCIDVPDTCDELEIRRLLVDLTFEGLTTPSKGPVAQADMRVWVGPDHQYAEMAKLVRAGKPIKFAPVRPAAAGSNDLVLTFTAPDDVVRP